MDKQAFFHLTSGLYILSASDGGRGVGCVVNTVTQVTSAPARLMAAVNKENFTCGAIRRARAFSAVVLSEEAGMELIGRFGFHSSRDTEKFRDLEFSVDANGAPYPTAGVNAQFSCKIVDELDVGSHVLFIGEVTDCVRLSDAPGMTYTYYHQVKKGMTPPKAPSYQADEPELPAAGGKQWRCSVCGYIYEGESLPADFRCPICGREAAVFQPL